jgi:ribose transport system permease protein
MSQPATEFTNVGTVAWFRRGFFASQTFYVFIAFAIITLTIAIIAPSFLTQGNLTNISKNFSFVAIVALGVTLVILIGGIDLSVGSVMALTAILTAMFMRYLGDTPLAAVPGLTLALAIGGGLLAAMLVGFINGVLIAKLELSPFVTTLGMLSIARGLCYALTEGRGQTPTDANIEVFYSLTDGQVVVIPGYLTVPVALIYLLVLAVIMGIALRHTAWGRHVFAIGGNERAAVLTGVNVARVKIGVYVLCSLSAGFAGILMVGWLGSAPANLAFGYELRIIAASVIGGANLAGGIGGPVGAVLGAALIEIIRNGLVLRGVNPYWQDTIIGLIIIFAVLVDHFRVRRIP